MPLRFDVDIIHVIETKLIYYSVGIALFEPC